MNKVRERKSANRSKQSPRLQHKKAKVKAKVNGHEEYEHEHEHEHGHDYEYVGWTGRHYSRKYDKSLLTKLFIILVDLVYCTYITMIGLPEYVIDVVRTNLFTKRENRLPDSIQDLVDPETYGRVTGRRVSLCEYANQQEQHANSTERAWLRVVYEDGVESEEVYVFAKCHAKTLAIRLMLSVFDAYRNELHAYSRLKMPVTVPEVHCARWTRSRFVLVMEDLGRKGVQFPNIWSTHVSMDLAKQVLTTLAKIHATFWGPKVPAGIWDDSNRPYLPVISGLFTLYNVRRRCKKDLFSDDAFAVFEQALYNWPKIRAYMSRRGPDHPKCLCHGDTHMGNFYIQKDGTIGTFDFQVLSEEHPMRDVAYFLMSSYPADSLGEDEHVLIEYYLSELQRLGVADPPSFKNAWLNYRLQSWYALYAFVFSGGASNLMDAKQTECGVSRILCAMDRIDAAGALYDLLDGKI